jgi:hypothetical protein
MDILTDGCMDGWMVHWLIEWQYNIAQTTSVGDRSYTADRKHIFNLDHVLYCLIYPEPGSSFSCIAFVNNGLTDLTTRLYNEFYTLNATCRVACYVC